MLTTLEGMLHPPAISMLHLAVVFNLLASVCCSDASVNPSFGPSLGPGVEDESPSLTLFRSNMNISARLATTVVSYELVNSRNCTRTHDFDLFLPTRARVLNMTLFMSNGCSIIGSVEAEPDALSSFEAASQSGSAAAVLTSWETSSYKLQVSSPPLTDVRVDITYCELLQRSDGAIRFHMPLSPGAPARALESRVLIREPGSGVLAITVPTEIPGASADVRGILSGPSEEAAAELLVATAGAANLPGLVRCSYDVGPLPEEGLLLADEFGALIHIFAPPSLRGTFLPRDVVIVIDVSGSMTGQKLLDAKAALGALLPIFTSEDAIAVHSFASASTEHALSPRRADDAGREEARAFVEQFEAGGGTELEGAYLDGIQRLAEMSSPPRSAVPVLVLLTDGQASGDASSIAASVTRANTDVGAKVFALAFGRGADLGLLMAIALQNGGVALPIYEGFGDGATQIQEAVQNAIGQVQLADVSVSFDTGSAEELESTVARFPVLAGGNEIVVHARSVSGLLPTATSGNIRGGRLGSAIRATTTAAGGFERVAQLNASPTLEGRAASVGFAYSRIEGLMMEAFVAQRLRETDNAEALKRSALELALQYGVVWPGLTAIVSLPVGSCRVSDAVPQSCDAMDVENAIGDRQSADGVNGLSLEHTTSSSCPPIIVAMVFVACFVHTFLLS